MEGVFSLVKDNPNKVVNLDYQPQPGVKLKLVSPASDEATLNYFTQNNLQPVSISNTVDLAVGGDFNDDYNNDYFG